MSGKRSGRPAGLDRRAFLGAGLGALAGCSRRDGPGEGYALVANQEGRSVAAVDLQALAVIRHIRLDAAPSSVVAHPTQPVFYVLTPEDGAVHEITAERLAVTRTARLGAPAELMRPAPDGRSLWVLERAARRLRRVALDSMRAAESIALAGEPLDFDLSHERAVVAYGGDGQAAAAIFDLASGRLEHAPRPGSPAGAVRFRPDGRQILVAQPAARILSIYEADSGALVTHLPLALEPQHFCFNQDGGQLFITGRGQEAVVVVFPYVTEVRETALVGHAPGAMAASAEFLFVASPEGGDVSILEIETRKVIAVVAVGAQPVFITVTPSNRYALVLNRQSGDVAVLLIPAIKASRSKRAPLFTLIPVGSAPVSAAVEQV